MAVFKRNIQNPSSPDKDIKAAGAARYKQSTFARLADINAATRSDNDQIAYTLALGSSQTGSIPISTKKGVVKITSTYTATASIIVSLTNSELLLADTDKYFVQATVSHATKLVYVTAVPIAADGIIAFKISQVGTPLEAFSTVFLNFSIYKIGD
jgi:hypothetical protein